MKAKVTNDVLESYIHCRYKGYLKLIGQSGIKSDYEKLRFKLRREVKHHALRKIHAKADEGQIINDVSLNTSILEKSSLFILNVSVENSHFSFILDGIKKVTTKRKNSFYAPILFYEGSRIRKEQRLFLELLAILLFDYQIVIPVVGIIWHGKECKQTTVHLNTDSRKFKQTLLDLKKIYAGEEVPKLVLNNHCQICEFKAYCYEKAQQEDNLSLIRGISEKEIKSFNRKGILTVTQLSHTFRPRRKRKNVTKESNPHYHALQALAIRDQKIYIFGTAQVPDSSVSIYLDVESDPDIDFVYLIGLLIVEDGSEKRYLFWADSKEQEAKIFEQFINEVTQRKEFTIFCYGSYEQAFIRKMKKAWLDKALIDRILDATVNTLSIIYAHIYFPTYSNGLKDIANYLGFSWTESDASGLQSIVWRKKWEASSDNSWKHKLLTYNIEDCIALKIVTETIRRISSKTNSEKESFVDDRSNRFVSFVENIDESSSHRDWREIKFAQPEFEIINRKAYFDYQQERVYIRSSKAIRKAKTRKSSYPNRRLAASKKITLVASECPICKSKDVLHGIKKKVRTQEPRVKQAFDLIFTPTGVRRRVIEYRTSIHKCLNCNKEFVPIEYQSLDRHLHGLKSWVMFQHVEYKTNLRVLSKMLEIFFGVHLAYPEIHMLKLLMAKYYELTYQRILADIIAGKLVHIDETEVNLRNQSGYVWVFTNLEEVVYLYRPSREGGFLHELLADFKGVLVSDFYAAYDGIECQQQKCLIHLLRDMNQALLDNPFDEQLKSITQPFGVLLRKIVMTIDKYGLKKKYLIRHALEVEDFFHSIDDRLGLSDAAEALQTRLIKNRNKLFTFIRHDGIPWNNNNAEHAVKQFAYYREIYDRTITQSGLENYLVLLSICQTCHYKGLNFLEFLISKELNIDAFSQRRRQRRKLSNIELYPKGFVPPSRP